jgi:hypothetical protein
MPQVDDNRLYTPRKFNPTTRQRFFRSRTDGLIRHVGGAPSRAQLVLIRRIVRNEWDLLRLDARFDEEELSGYAMRARLAMENRLRLDLNALLGLDAPGKVAARAADRAFLDTIIQTTRRP